MIKALLRTAAPAAVPTLPACAQVAEPHRNED